MTNREFSASISGLMFYLLAIIMFLAGCVIVLGYLGRGPREERNPEQGKER